MLFIVHPSRDNLFLALYKDPLTTAPVKRTIYLSRHGESQYNLYGKIGGDSGLSSQGLKYALKLAAHFEQLKLDNFQVRTKWLIHAIFHDEYSVLKEKITLGKENASLFLVLSLHLFFGCQLCFVLLADTAAQGSKEDG